jgi:hypothetical protein
MDSWTIYDHPTDYPDCFVARRFELGKGPEPVPTAEVVTSPDIEPLRRRFMRSGLVRFRRAPSDDSKIVETWM